ncbi:hypothetical protein MASR1M60_19060 [Rhodocyclaceae bacterium]
MTFSALAWIVFLPLAILLGLASWHDVNHQRIPNRLVAAGTVWAFAAHALLPGGSGFLSLPAGGLGLPAALGGLLIGGLLLMPLYGLGTMGAGDIKLLAMLGAFLGPQHIAGAVLFSLLAVTLLSLPVLIKKRRLGGSLPFAVAIACGTLAYVGLLWMRAAAGGTA